jgi:thiamine biosynthesis lipoprotein
MYHTITHSRKITRLLVMSVFAGIFLAGVVIFRLRTVPKLYRQSRFLLGTVVDLMVVSSSERHAQEAMEAAYAEMSRAEALLNRYDDKSQIARINKRAGSEMISVDREVQEILQRSLHYAVRTDGLFDITVGALIDLWGIGTDRERVPDSEELQRTLQYVDYRYLELHVDQGVRLRFPEVTLDLGGVAKGYSIDRGIEILRSHDVTGALLNAGGDIRGFGTKIDGAPWRIGVRHPRDPGILGVVELRDRAIATSGDYERYFLSQGTRYHHIFVPHTGMPARECQSVTILAETAEEADVWATTVFLLGPERGLAFIEEETSIEGMIVNADGEIILSSGFSLNPQ